MRRRLAALGFGTMIATGIVAAISPASAQTFDSYRCVDGTQFILTFYPSDKRPYIQIDGHSVQLRMSLSLRDRRYSGGGVRVVMTSGGALLRHLRRPVTACGRF